VLASLVGDPARGNRNACAHAAVALAAALGAWPALGAACSALASDADEHKQRCGALLLRRLSEHALESRGGASVAGCLELSEALEIAQRLAQHTVASVDGVIAACALGSVLGRCLVAEGGAAFGTLVATTTAWLVPHCLTVCGACLHGDGRDIRDILGALSGLVASAFPLMAPHTPAAVDALTSVLRCAGLAAEMRCAAAECVACLAEAAAAALGPSAAAPLFSAAGESLVGLLALVDGDEDFTDDTCVCLGRLRGRKVCSQANRFSCATPCVVS